MLRTSYSTGLSKNSIIAAVVENNEVESNNDNDITNKMVKNLSKSKKSKHFTKLSKSCQCVA